MSCETPILYYVPFSGTGPPPTPPPGGGGGNTVPVPIIQPNHGFIVGDIVRFDGIQYVKALSDTAQNAEVVGMVLAVYDDDTFALATPGGRITGLSGFTPGITYFLSDTIPGRLVPDEPVITDEISKPLLIADSSSSGYFFNWRGMVISGDITETTLTVDQLNIGTDLRLVSITGGGKLQARDPGLDTWADVDQWTNP